MAQAKLTVGVVFGGRSCEHEVSLRSAQSVMAAINTERFDILPIAVTKTGEWRILDAPRFEGHKVLALPAAGRSLNLRPEPRRAIDISAELPALDLIFPVLHGPYGEDGTVQGLFELADIPYVGSGVLASAAGMDKAVMKALFQQAGLPVAPYRVVMRRQWQRQPAEIQRECEAAFPYPWFVKPANMGSSVGVVKVRRPEELADAMATAAQYDRKILVEAAIQPAREIEVAVMGNDAPRASLPGEIRPKGEFYDYRAKYIDDDSELCIPADLAPEVTALMQQYAVAAFQAIDCAGLARIDFLLEEATQIPYLLEINTMPGFTSISMFPKLWEASGVAYGELIETLIQLALERHGEKQLNQTHFSDLDQL